MKKILFCLLMPLFAVAQNFSPAEINRYKAQAQRVTIVRDNWGIPHIYGQSDADAVFGLMYAQCEDDFPRIEMNYLEKLGRLAEVKGEAMLFDDLQIQMLIDTADAKADYKKAEPWLKKLLDAHADGINFYLQTHPSVKPVLLKRFEPWFPLLWTDGSIGAISTADLSVAELKAFYTGDNSLSATKKFDHDMQSGSNGFAVAPSKSATGHSLFYINPHTTFYFRPEVQVQSEEGLNVYGAVTWGQFFIYQGFNEQCGWMHTSSAVDVSDIYAETIVKKKGKLYYKHGDKLKTVTVKTKTLRYLDKGGLKTKSFTTYFTHHGPVMAKRDGKWISLAHYNRAMKSLVQSFIRTKAKGFEDYKKAMDLCANTSNNTVFADNKGNIAYWHGNYVPVRDPKTNWGKVVDGSNPAYDWRGLHPVEQTVHSYNPPNGWVQNCNSTPYTCAGDQSPKKENYAPYMAPDGENFRGVNAVRVLSRENAFTLDKLIAAGYDTYLAAFEVLIPTLVKSFETHIKPEDPRYKELVEPIAVLKNWNYYAAENSVATTLAIEWAQRLNPTIQKIYISEDDIDQVEGTKQFATKATPDDLFPPLLRGIAELKAKFGTWQVAWGDLNRFQRISNAIEHPFDDAKPSHPVAYASSLWGCLPAYRSNYYKNSAKRYGTGGNSFVCAVEFGPKIKAKSLLAGGGSGDPTSPHFTDQLVRYTKGQFKDVLFYKEDVMKHAERTYHPSE
ncbi:MAG: penicillin acylase family protein [Saprospiraceae bacterium]|nr:penicillin acylase family protein [Saprospiraceae bacterium]